MTIRRWGLARTVACVVVLALAGCCKPGLPIEGVDAGVDGHPETCVMAQVECGPIDEGHQLINCGVCAAPLACSAGSCR